MTTAWSQGAGGHRDVGRRGPEPGRHGPTSGERRSQQDRLASSSREAARPLGGSEQPRWMLLTVRSHELEVPGHRLKSDFNFSVAVDKRH